VRGGRRGGATDPHEGVPAVDTNDGDVDPSPHTSQTRSSPTRALATGTFLLRLSAVPAARARPALTPRLAPPPPRRAAPVAARAAAARVAAALGALPAHAEEVARDLAPRPRADMAAANQAKVASFAPKPKWLRTEISIYRYIYE